MNWSHSQRIRPRALRVAFAAAAVSFVLIRERDFVAAAEGAELGDPAVAG
jgi:hypothetical protein